MRTITHDSILRPNGLRYSPENIVAGYGRWVSELVDAGYEPTLLTFMFNPIHGPPAAVAYAMEREIERVYGWMLTRRCRRPKETPNHMLPILIACPDWPVPKQHKQALQDAVINGGRHAHGIDLAPKNTRLPCELADFVDKHQDDLAGPDRLLARLHAVTLRKTPERAVSYVLKSLPRGRATGDDLIVLPRAGSEKHHRTPL